ncbi:MauE/DoxX family redox-associated membrane protein [uncultured Draconibacterium sp.]|uniref:MauE/DoxX family redox-associated membrane protein n=1 Tax=uncultured Draconibacterium sp. TaxID=1573823 RepID=UPI002AA65DBE|nr:MauE/DoxX family redox-associated membrane protein [uncultured Draconibacterium sp.]
MKKLQTKHFSIIVTVTSYLYILLFVYSGISKLLDYETFTVQLAQSPLLSAYAGIIAPAVIGLELVLALLLIPKNTRLIGLYASLFLMVAFTIYIYLILNYSDFVPCSCGGIIEKMNWTEHMIFNIAFVILALIAIVLSEKEKHTSKRTVLLKTSLPSLLAAGVVVGLFLSSEHIIKKENNFIRRFGQHPIRDEKAFDLGVNSYYFAGMFDGQIYLGNLTAPLVLTSIDTALTRVETVKIELDDEKHSFRFIQLQVKSPHFYLFDGTVPVIYRGLLSDSLAHTISADDCYFSQLQVIDSVKLAFRAQSSQSKTQVLGLLHLEQHPKVTLFESLLEKQVDGMFDTDGRLLQDEETGELIYIYTYRNQFLIMNQDLSLLRKLHTIDNISQARVQVYTFSDGRHKMNAPPLKVNKTSVVHRQVLFNVSNLMGRFESRELWTKTSVIDLYRTDQQEYLGSLYVNDRGKNKLSGMLATDNYLFVLCGSEIVRYRFAQALMQDFAAGEAEKPEIE